MEYKKAYHDTLEQLFFASQTLVDREYQDTVKLKCFQNMNEVIQVFWDGMEKSTGERKSKSEDNFNKLVFVFDRLGNMFLTELKARKDKAEFDIALIEASKRIEELEKRIKELEGINTF